MAYEKQKLENWQKFPLTDSVIVGNLRTMLDLEDGEDFPEELWKVMAIHKCLESHFMINPMSPRDLASLVVESAALRHPYGSNIKFVPGERVFVTKVQREGTYWFCAPHNRHMVNCQGDIFLVKASEIEAPESAISGSTFNKNAALGAKISASVPEHLKPKEPALVG